MKEFLAEAIGELERLYKVSTSIIIVSLFSGILRTVFSEERRSLIGYCRGLGLALFVAFLVSNLLAAYDLHEGIKVFCIALSAFSADDILFVFLKLMKIIRDNPVESLKSVVNFLLRRKNEK